MRTIINKDSYIGFTFANKHSSQFGIKSVTNGDRYQRYLSPEFTDVTGNRVGADGTYYFNSFKNRKVLNFNIAFDDMTEEEFREMKEWLNQDISELVLDELPYIKYYCKVQNIIQVSFLPFLDENDEAILKGEFQISFVCYDPFGYSVFKWLDNYSQYGYELSGNMYSSVNNMTDWMESSRLLYTQEFEGHKIDKYTNGKIELYNGGDYSADFILQIPYIQNQLTIKLLKNNDLLGQMKFDFSKIQQYTNIQGDIYIDTAKRMVYIKKDNIKIPILDSWIAGDFFKIPKSKDIKDFFNLELSNPIFKENNVIITYDYKYL